MKNNNNFDAEKNKLFIGNSDKLSEWLKIDEKNQEKAIELTSELTRN